ncbi:MAG: peptide chain release factor N(5)-glutamine methyltransferase [Nitrospirae bacterium]|nr:peptide chain release factor N(5)-glutamine methyltransferase [Nitrospirota bacterium]
MYPLSRSYKMNTLNILDKVTKTLKCHGVEYAQKEAKALIKEGLNISDVEIYRDNSECNEEQLSIIEEMLKRRVSREPLQYVLGYEEFLGLRILVGQGVLIPRPETELMAEQAVKTVKSEKLKVKSYEDKNSSLITHHSSLNILDLCTGSGCLALAIAKAFPDAQVYGADISEVAVMYAKENARLNYMNNVTFLKGDLFEPIKKFLTSQFSLLTFDLIISNPPYIKTADIKTLQPEVRDWEPVIALDGGEDGLNIYRELIPAAKVFLKDNGILMLEMDLGQAGEITKMLKSSGYTEIEIIKDYAGIERVAKAKKKTCN